jgi:hypothetical protein
VKMTFQEFSNSGLGVLVIGSAFGVLGFFVRKLWASIELLDNKVLKLEFESANHETTKHSIAGIGKRVGEAEADIKMATQRMEQYEGILSEIREDRKTHNQIVADIYGLLNKMQVDIGILKNEVRK